MQAPSLFDSTTTGLPFSAWRNTRSQLTYMLFTSTSANIDAPRALARDLLDHVRHDTPDVEGVAIAGVKAVLSVLPLSANILPFPKSGKRHSAAIEGRRVHSRRAGAGTFTRT